MLVPEFQENQTKTKVATVLPFLAGEPPNLLAVCVWLIEFVHSLLHIQFWPDFSEIFDFGF